MPSREVEYTSGVTGYNAIVADLTEMLAWDSIEPKEASSGQLYTDFTKNCGGGTYVGLSATILNANEYPRISAIANNGASSFVDGGGMSNGGYHARYVGYAYGGNFLAFCADDNPLPNTGSGFGGISSARNITTGETGWCSFTRTATASYSGRETCDYTLFSKDSKGVVITDWCISSNAKIGAAVSVHSPATGWVSDKVMILTAIPDTYQNCMATVIFNGIRYVRLGKLLVPAE